MYQNILVPVDGSDTAERALREAIQLARSLSSRIRVIHVVNGVPWVAQGAPGIIGELVTQLRSTGESIVHEAKAAVRSAGIEVDHRLIEAIGEYTERLSLPRRMIGRPSSLCAARTGGAA